MTPIRHIVFDIGKVLVHYDPELPFRRTIPDDRRREWFLARSVRMTGTWSRIAAALDRGGRRTDRALSRRGGQYPRLPPPLDGNGALCL
jgi:2-haloacid dehalogenase